MDTILELSVAILPVFITGIFTFSITKYTYNKNIPLDKLEIAYNRVYYPLHRIILNPNNSDENIISKSKEYFDKYNKYIDTSTIRVYNSLCNCDNNTERKYICQRYKDNISNKSSYLRRKLGYLESNFVELYKYATPSKRSEFRMLLEFSSIYILLIFCAATIDTIKIIYWSCLYLVTTIFIVFIIEIGICICRTIYYKMRK